MPETTPNPTNAGSSADLATVLQQTERELATLKAKLASSSKTTAIVALIVLALVSGYFTYGYTEFSSVLQPKEIVNAAASYVEDQIPQIRQQIEGQIKDNAPEWVQLVSDEGFAAIPDLRGALEDFALSQLNEVFDQVATLTEDEFKKFLTENRDLVETTFKELADNPKVSDDLLKQLEEALDQQLGVEMKTQAEDLLSTLEKLGDEVEKLKEGKNLGELEAKKRRILMIARLLQHEQALQKEEDEMEILKPLQEAVKGPDEKDAG